MNSPILVVDVAHPPRPPQHIELELTHAWGRVRNSSTLRILKIVHGYGSSGKGGASRTVVRNWAFQHRHRFQRIIEGERYTLSDADTQDLVREIGDYPDVDRGTDNPGILLIWVK